MAIITQCAHCGERRKGEANKFCAHCNTAEKRREMDKNNKELWDDVRTNKDNPSYNPNLPEYKCNYCDSKQNKDV